MLIAKPLHTTAFELEHLAIGYVYFIISKVWSFLSTETIILMFCEQCIKIITSHLTKIILLSIRQCLKFTIFRKKEETYQMTLIMHAFSMRYLSTILTDKFNSTREINKYAKLKIVLIECRRVPKIPIMCYTTQKMHL